MKEAKGQTTPKTGDGNTSEFGAVTIDFNPGPDAQDRLRRLFTLLLNHAAREREAAPDDDFPADAQFNDSPEEEASSFSAHNGGAL